MRFSKKGVIALSLLTIVLAGLMISFVSAQTTGAGGAVKGVFQSLWEAFFGKLPDNFLNSERFQVGVTRWFLIALVVLIVYGVSDFIPFIGSKDYIRWGFAGIVGILSFLFVKPEVIISLVSTYEALGVALAVVIPLMVLIAISLKLQDGAKEADATKAVLYGLLNKIILVVFAVYLLFKLAFITQDYPGKTNYLWVPVIALVTTLFFLFAGGWISNLIRKEKEAIVTTQVQSQEEAEKITVVGKVYKEMLEAIDQNNKTAAQALFSKWVSSINSASVAGADVDNYSKNVGNIKSQISALK